MKLIVEKIVTLKGVKYKNRYHIKLQRIIRNFSYKIWQLIHLQEEIEEGCIISIQEVKV